MTIRKKTIEIAGCLAILIVICIGIITLLPNSCTDNFKNNTSVIELTNNVKLEQSKANKYFFDFKQKEQENNELQQQLAKMKLNLKPKIVYLQSVQKASSKKPETVNNLTACNDTISKLYYIGQKKDSLANGVIFDLNGMLTKSDSIISGQDTEKELLLNTILHNSNAMNDLEKINTNNKDFIRKKNNENLFWKSTTAGALIIIGKLILFK